MSELVVFVEARGRVWPDVGHDLARVLGSICPGVVRVVGPGAGSAVGHIAVDPPEGPSFQVRFVGQRAIVCDAQEEEQLGMVGVSLARLVEPHGLDVLAVFGDWTQAREVRATDPGNVLEGVGAWPEWDPREFGVER